VNGISSGLAVRTKLTVGFLLDDSILWTVFWPTFRPGKYFLVMEVTGVDVRCLTATSLVFGSSESAHLGDVEKVLG